MWRFRRRLGVAGFCWERMRRARNEDERGAAIVVCRIGENQRRYENENEKAEKMRR